VLSDATTEVLPVTDDAQLDFVVENELAQCKKLGFARSFREESFGAEFEQCVEDNPLLSVAEEIALGNSVRRLMELRKVHEQLMQQSNSESVSLCEWATAADIPVPQLESELACGWKARERMVLCNLKLVIKMAGLYKAKGVGYLDLIQLGMSGLITGVERFDARKGYRFTTYASWWIRQTMVSGKMTFSKTIRLPVHVISRLNRIRREMSTQHQDGRRAPLDELSHKLKIPKKTLELTLNMARSTVSLDSVPFGSECKQGDRAVLFSDVLEDTIRKKPEEVVTERLFRAELNDVMRRLLCPRELAVLSMRFGLETSLPMTLDAVGQQVGLTKERVRQIEGSAFRKIRNSSIAPSLRLYLAEL